MSAEAVMKFSHDPHPEGQTTEFEDPFSREVWETTYKHHSDATVNDTFWRVARYVAGAEETEALRQEWALTFYDMLTGFKCTPGGRILANAGAGWNGTTLANCFVSPRGNYDIDSISGIITDIENQAQTLKSEGGWGQNFSWLRPRGAFIHGVGVETPGAVKYMEIYDKVSDVITAGSGRKSAQSKAKSKIRKGAMMSILDVWHPDIIEFIAAKQQPGRLTKFNMSVNCTDEFMAKVILARQLENKMDRLSKRILRTQGDATGLQQEHTSLAEQFEEVDRWSLRFPETTYSSYKEEWDGDIKAWEAKGYPTVEYRQVSVLWLWNLITESTYNRNEPGVLFLDRANHYDPLSSYHHKIVATNPCVSGDTWVQTSKGPRQVLDLVGSQFESELDGVAHESSSRGFFRTGKRETVRLSTSEGYQLRLTPDHRLRKVTDLTRHSKGVEWCAVQDLSPGDLVLINDHRPNGLWAGSGTHGEGYLLGLLVGDGTIKKDRTVLSVWRQNLAVGDVDLDPCFPIMEAALEAVKALSCGPTFRGWTEIAERGEFRLATKALANLASGMGLSSEVKTVTKSIECASSAFYCGFLRGLFDADGSVQGTQSKGVSVRLSQSSLATLEGVQRMLLRLGIASRIYQNRRKEGTSLLPDGKGHSKLYPTRANHELVVSCENLQRFSDIVGFTDAAKRNHLKALLSTYKREHNKERFVAHVESVEAAGPTEVFDVEIPGVNSFDANGFHAHNCGEQALPPGGVCDLGSINLTQFVTKERQGFDLDRVRQYTRSLVRFLDNVNTLSHAPLQEYVDSMRDKRRIGIGILGWGSSLLLMKIRFGSERARELRDLVMQAIATEAYMASIDLAEEKGMFRYCQPEKHAEAPFVRELGLSTEYIEKLRRFGIRNSSLLSIQPTGNTSCLANVVSGGLEPIFLPEYTRTVILGSIPDEIADQCPRWFEDAWHETDLFKFAKEGDDEILRGEFNGTVYKIDRNRGLTKEVPCADYAVRRLKEDNDWDPKADWAVTTTGLSVNDHIGDMKGFARWVDSSISKTVNLPNKYPYDDFQDLYLDAYTSGKIRGLTTYRAGTMMTVLSAKEEREGYEEEVIKDDVKLPNQMPSTTTTMRADGKKWWITTLMDEGGRRPVAFFVSTNHSEKDATTHDAVDRLMDLAKRKRIPKRWRDKTEEKMRRDNNVQKVCRAAALNLRHGVLIKNVVSALDSVEDVYVGSFLFQFRKHLSRFIQDGEKAEDEKCVECGGEIVYSEGCKKCTSCGSSKCG